MKKYAVIVAGGTGLRMGTEIPKQFLLLNGKPLLWHSINAFASAFSDIEIIVALPQQFIEEGKQIAESFSTHKIETVTGGVTRFDSVKNGLALVKEDSVVFVHDAVRCLVKPGLIHNCYGQTLKKGSAIPCVTATDSLRKKEGIDKHYALNREQVKLVQTPQTFLSAILLPAFNAAYQPSFTDEATVVESFGKEIFLIDGDYDNFKITRPIDLLIAEEVMKNKI